MELVRTRKGGLTLRVAGSDGADRILHSLYDPAGEAAGMVDAFAFDGEGMIVVLGLGLGYHIEELRRRHPRARIVVVEGFPEILDLCREHGKGADPSESVRFVVGRPPAEAVAEISRLHLKAGLPPLSVFPLVSETSAFPGYYGPIRDALRRTVSFRLWERLRYPKFRSDRLTVALFDFGYFLTEEIARALEALGHTVVRVRGKKDETCGDVLGRAVETIASDRPDFFLTVNHLGFDEDGALADLFRSIEMPAAVWYVDSPDLVVKAFPRNASPFCCVFAWDDGYLKSLKGLGFGNVAYLPLAADETLFRPRAMSSAEKRRIGSDVGFVGNSMVAPARERLLRVDRTLRPAVERTAQRLGSARDLSFGDAVETALHDDERAAFDALPPRERSVFEAAVLWRATLLYRLSRLRALEEFRPYVRGDAGWKGLLNGKFRLGPPLSYYGELPSFYNACKVNFNATSVQMGTAVNQRAFDVPACGAFLLTDRQASLEALFEVGEEVIAYNDIDEIDDLARFYLRNDSAREAVAAKGRGRVLREHTYRHRLGEIVRRLRELYG
jgi:spore maturation protein CgeB